jgi:hypothetical protein
MINTMTSQPPLPAPGWYPSQPGSEAWWDGQRWTGRTRPTSTDFVAPRDHPATTPEQIGTFGIVGGAILAVIGVAMQFQSVSLLTGAGMLWIGAGLTLGGVVAIFALHGQTVLRVLAIIALVFCVANVAYAEHELDQKRQQIQSIFGS